MKLSRKVVTLAVTVLLVSIRIGQGQTGNGGATGLAFLKIGVGARAAAMGEAHTAVGNDATATYWNPAALGAFSRTHLSLSHTTWLQDVTHDFLAVAFPAFGGGVGVSFYALTVGDLERRVTASSEPIGTFQANNIAAGLSYGRSLTSNLSAGISGKYIYEKTFTESASGYAFDFALTGQPFDFPLKLAAVVQNIGSMNELRLQASKLPTMVRFGGAYQFGFEDFSHFIVSVESVKILDADSWTAFGVELLLKRHLLVRAGYQAGIDEKSFSTGFGLQLKRYHFDYGFTPFGSDLGNVQRFSLSLDL